MSNLSTDQSYKQLLAEVKGKIRDAQIRAMVTVNQQMLLLYWEIGNLILERQDASKWGDDVIGQLSIDLKMELPGMHGFSTRNLKYMRAFAREYPDFSIGQQPVAQISWSHNILLLQKCTDLNQRQGPSGQQLKHLGKVGTCSLCF